MPAEIIVEGLTKQYGAVTAVKDLNLEVGQGEIYGLMGPDGAGKTSLLRCLAGVLDFKGGRAALGGFDVRKQTEQVKNVLGYMSQRFSLYEELSVRENLNFVADLYRVPRQEKAVRGEELLAFANLTDHQKKLAGQLSGGMKQKLALCCSLIHTPRALLLDEPTTGVDPVSRKEFWQILFRLKEKGVAILVSTPYLDEAERCDRVGLMIQGSIAREGTPQAIKKAFPAEILQIKAGPVFDVKNFLAQMPEVETVIIKGDLVKAVVGNAQAVHSLLAERLGSAGYDVAEIKQVKASLEDVVIYSLLNRTEGGSADVPGY